MTNIIRTAFLAVFLFFVIACGNKIDAVQKTSDTSDSSTPAQTVSYSADIQPILASRCLSCHSEAKQGLDRNGARVGVDFDTYELAKENAERANSRIQSGSMPPSSGIPEEERQLFQLWLDQGTPE